MVQRQVWLCSLIYVSDSSYTLETFFRLVGWEFDLCCWHGLQHNLLVLALFSWLWLVTGADLLWEKNIVGGWCWFVVREKHHCWLPTEVDLNLKCNQCWKFKPDIFHMRSIQWLPVFASVMFSFPVAGRMRRPHAAYCSAKNIITRCSDWAEPAQNLRQQANNRPTATVGNSQQRTSILRSDLMRFVIGA